MYLFVYGTLKRGYHNNHYLEDQTFVREAETVPRFRLFANDTFPMLVRDKNNGYSVKGELWNIDEDILDELDLHEALYERKLIKIRGKKDLVWTYIYSYPIHSYLRECYSEWP